MRTSPAPLSAYAAQANGPGAAGISPHAQESAWTHLVLFDIDGTLLSMQGRGALALHEALQEVWGYDTQSLPYSLHGKTELEICHALLRLAGVPPEQIRERLHRLWPAYVRRLKQQLQAREVLVHPGAHALVRAVAAHPHWVCGLLTGNCPPAAQVKLRAAGLQGFALGAFGSRHVDRAELPALADARAQRVVKRSFPGPAMVILGDTPNDLRCARVWGARCILVGTGSYSLDALAEHQPDYLFADFSQTEQVLQAIAGSNLMPRP